MCQRNVNYCRKAYINIDQPDDIFCCLRETQFIVAEAISNGWLMAPNMILKLKRIEAKLNKQDQRSQKLTPRVPKGNKTRGFKVKTSIQKLKSQYVSSAKQSKN